MIAALLIDNPALMPVLVLLTAVICVAAGYLILRVRRYRQRILWALAALSVVPIAALALVPIPTRRMDDIALCTSEFDMPTLTSVEMVANSALLFPLVFFTALATRRPLLICAAGIELSAAIEIVQALVRSLGRVCDLNDWAMNSIGVVAAALLAGATIALAARTAAKKDAAAGHSPR
jgi:membrane-associated HD superfamily phosphohydrolase